jgi:hypothetical protein
MPKFIEENKENPQDSLRPNRTSPTHQATAVLLKTSRSTLKISQFDIFICKEMAAFNHACRTEDVWPQAEKDRQDMTITVFSNC